MGIALGLGQSPSLSQVVCSPYLRYFVAFLQHVQIEFIVSTAVNRDVLNVKVSSDADKRILKVFKAITSQRASPVHKT